MPHSAEFLDEEAILKAESQDEGSELYSSHTTSDNDISGEGNEVTGPEEASLLKQPFTTPEAFTEERYNSLAVDSCRILQCVPLLFDCMVLCVSLPNEVLLPKKALTTR